METKLIVSDPPVMMGKPPLPRMESRTLATTPRRAAVRLGHGLVITLLFCLFLPTASLALGVSDVLKAYGRSGSTAGFDEDVKRMIDDTLEGRGMVLNVHKSGLSGGWNVHIAAYNEEGIGFVVIVPISSAGIPFRQKNDVSFSGRIKGIVVRTGYDGGKHFEVPMLSGDVTLLGEISVWKAPERNKVEQAPKQGTGTVDVAGYPKGARVYLDGSLAGSLPCILEKVAPGSHNIRIEFDGFHEHSEQVTVSVDRPFVLRVDLSPIPIVVNPEPIEPVEKAKPYMWKDEKGQFHITDKPPPHLLNQDAPP